MSLLEIKNVSKIYGPLKALDNVNLTVENGEWLAIMGPSGSGKSTMMNIIGCMDKPSLGEVILDGADIAKESGRKLTEIRRDKIGLIFQQFHLVNYLTAVENVMVSQYYHSMPDEKEALEALERVGLKDRAKHLPSQLSGGEQQRVCSDLQSCISRGRKNARPDISNICGNAGSAQRLSNADCRHARPGGRRGRSAHGCA